MVTLFLTGLEFYGFHGVPDEERVIGHRYRVDLELDVESLAEQTDDVHDTVDYGLTAKLVLDVCSGGPYRTVERLAFVVARTLLDRFSRLQRVRVRIAKPMPPAPIIAEQAGVSLELSR